MEDIFYIDRGWGFPPSFSKHTKSAEMVVDEEDIRQSIIIILSTKIGERKFHLDLGSEIKNLVFEDLNHINTTQLENTITKVLNIYETRILLNEVSVHANSEEGSVVTHIDYTITSKGTKHSIDLIFSLS